MSKIFQLTPASCAALVKVAQSLILNEQILAIPTDTIYGLAVNANNQRAIQRLYNVKGRNFNKPFAICVAEIEDIARYSDVTVSDTLLRELLPGAVTVMFKRSIHLNSCLNPNHDVVGIRVPDYTFVRELCRAGPIALTSANKSNEPSCLNIEEFSDLWPRIDAIFDGGSLGDIDPERHGSTIIDLSTAGHYRIVRNGCALEHTLRVLEKYKLSRLL